MSAPEAIPAPTGAREGSIDPTLVDGGSFERPLPADFSLTADPVFHLRQLAEVFGSCDEPEDRLDAAALRWAIDQLFLLYATRGKFGPWEGR